jgi:hypothetical protein
MTLHALMVSLGPSLKVGNGVLSELLKHRLQLFSKPPLRAEDSVTDLIDFGTTSIEPPTLGPIASIPLKDEAAEFATNPAEIKDDSPSKKPPKLSTKPSLTKLFSSSSRNLAHFTDQRPSTPSLVDVEPPRVDLTLAQTSPLPTFGLVPSSPMVDPSPPTPAQTTPVSVAESEKQKMDDPHYPAGTVRERTRALSSATPIADLFSRKTPQPPLRGDRNSMASSIGTSTSTRSLGDNPARVITRGHSAFFAGGGSGSIGNGDNKRNSRSVPNTPGDKRCSTPSSVREMIKDMEKRDF